MMKLSNALRKVNNLKYETFNPKIFKVHSYLQKNLDNKKFLAKNEPSKNLKVLKYF